MLRNAMNRCVNRASDERGSVIVAVIAIVVVSTSLLVMASTVERGMSAARIDQDRIEAFQHANAGIDLALWRIDRQIFSGGNYTATANGFTDLVAVDGSSYTVTASKVNDVSWQVRSLGTDDSGRTRLAIADITATPLFENAFFTVEDFYLTGNQDNPIAYDSSVCPNPMLNPAAAGCSFPFPVPGRLGTNAEIRGSAATTAAFVARWAGFDMYGRATQEAADDACDGGRCGTNPKVAAIPNRLEPQVPDVPASPSSCPSGGLVNGGTIVPGDYLCATLQLEGTVTIATTGGNGSGRVRIWVDGSFSVARNAVVNRGRPTPNLQIFQEANADGSAHSGSICGGEIWALLYTPGLSIDCNGSHQPAMFGAVIAQIHSGTGNHFDFHWDIRASEVSRDAKFVVKNWRECPATATDC